MHNYLQLALYVLAAECLRRIVLILKFAYTGPLAKIPGPWWSKLTGIPWMIENATGNAMNLAPGLFDKYGDVVRITPTDILFASKDAVNQILVDDDLAKAPIYSHVEMYPGVSNLITERNKAAYKAKRRLLSPGFAISYLDGLEPQMQECVRVFKDHLDMKIENENGYAVVDMSRSLSNLTFDIMSATSFGGSFGLVASDDQTLKKAFLSRLKRSALAAQIPWINYIPFLLPNKDDSFEVMNTKIISTRRAEIAAGKPIKRDLLQIVIDTRESMPDIFTELHMREEMSLFMIAGSDTAGFTLTATLLLLVSNPEKMAKLVKEIDDAFPDGDGNITFAKTQELSYLNAVLNESMRVMPILKLGLSRCTSQPTLIGGYVIPPEAVAVACPGRVSIDPEIWPDATSFVPERWLGPYKGVEVDRKAYMPFSAGSRNCPGQQFAMKEMRLVMAKLLKRYELTKIEGQNLEMRLHVVPWFLQGFYNVGVRRRERA